jgi:hypothetical protein
MTTPELQLPTPNELVVAPTSASAVGTWKLEIGDDQ